MFESIRLYPAIRWLAVGTLCTNTAFWMYQVAAGWLALQLTDSPFFVGLTAFAGGIPILLFALPSGVVVDRFERRTVLLGAQFGVMAVATLFSVLIFTGLIDRWSTMALAFGYGTAMSFVFPTRQAIISGMVEKRDLANAIALNAAGQNSTRIFGPSLAGMLIALFGIGGTFAVAAAMQIIAMATTLRLPAAENTVPRSRGPMMKTLTQGIVYVARDPILTGTIFLATIGTILIMPYIALMPVFVRDELGLGSTGLGLLMAGIGIGSVAGALTVAGSKRLVTAPGLQLAGVFLFALTVLLFSQSGWIPLAAMLLLLTGLISASFLATNQTVLQLRADEEIRGRVLAVNMITWGLLPVGQLPLGWLADRIGAPNAMTLSCLVALGLILLVAWRIPNMRQRLVYDDQ